MVMGNLATRERLPTTYARLSQDVQLGERIMLADGRLVLVVEHIEGTDVHARVEVGGVLTSSKGINLPGSQLSVPSLSKKDIDDLEFGLKMAYGWLIALGRMRQALFLQLSLNLFNVLLDLLFVYGLDAGAPGIAAAAALSQWLNLIPAAWWVLRTIRSRSGPHVSIAGVFAPGALRALLVVNVDIFWV